jgi:hypothetical protein
MDVPYRDGDTFVGDDMSEPTHWEGANNALDVIGNVEDIDDDGILDKQEDKRKNYEIDGDYIFRNPDYDPYSPDGDKNPWLYDKDLSPFNVDNDNPVQVELPVVVSVDDNTYEYILPQVLKHVVTHEIGHNVGVNLHTEEPFCVMYKSSSNWLRDNQFGDTAKQLIRIHNN